jgi:asparagine N-glycosylation enzyme membrane subunit Stt3
MKYHAFRTGRDVTRFAARAFGAIALFIILGIVLVWQIQPCDPYRVLATAILVPTFIFLALAIGRPDFVRMILGKRPKTTRNSPE